MNSNDEIIVGFHAGGISDKFHSIECTTNFTTGTRRVNVYYNEVGVPFYNIKTSADSDDHKIVAWDLLTHGDT